MKYLKFAFLMACLSSGAVFAQQNSIDADGTFGAIGTDGNAQSGSDMDSTKVTGATEFYTLKNGTGFLRLRGVQTGPVTVTITNAISSDSDGWAIDTIVNNNFDGSITFNSLDDIRDFGDASLDATKVQAQGNNKGAMWLDGVNPQSGGTITMNEGEYEGIRSRNFGASYRTGAGFGALIRDFSGLTINGTSFQGGDGDTGRGGAGLLAIDAGNLTINYAESGAEDYMRGGDGGQSSVQASDINQGSSAHGGDGLLVIVPGSQFSSTYINTEGGDGGKSTTTTETRINISVTADGGAGAWFDGSATFSVSGGRAIGGNGGEATGTSSETLETGALVVSRGGGGFDLNLVNGGSFFTNFLASGGAGGTSVQNGNHGLTTIRVNSEGVTVDEGAIYAMGGDGLNIDFSSGAIEAGGTFSGGRGGFSQAKGAGAGDSNAHGGFGIDNNGFATITAQGSFIGADGGSAFLNTSETAYNPFIGAEETGDAFAFGGDGIRSALIANGGVFSGGNGGSSEIRNGSGTANSQGGNGATASGSSTINDGVFTGGKGGKSSVSAGTAFSDGGHGVEFAGTKLTINGGTFQGGQGGSANASLNEGASSADGGSGIYLSAGELEINGGIFSGAKAGNANSAAEGAGIRAVDSALNITASATDAVINDNIDFSNSGGTRTFNFLAGHVNGDIDVENSGIVNMAVSENATYTGMFNQNGGELNVNLNASEDAKFFTDFDIKSSDVTFAGFEAITAEGASYTMDEGSSMTFAQGLFLSTNASIDAGYAPITASAGNVTMDENSTIKLTYRGFNSGATNPVFGKIDITSGVLDISAPNALLSIQGAAATPDGFDQIVSANGPTLFGANSNSTENVIQADLGWLTTNALDTTAGVGISWGYNSLSNNTSLADLEELIPALDEIITSSNSVERGMFYIINELGEEEGSRLIRYSETQIPDTMETAFQNQAQISGELVARSSEYRSMNGFASSSPLKPGQHSPVVGVAGPDVQNKGLSAWIRAYGGMGKRDSEGDYAAYDSSLYGTIIGVDKSFGKMLLGLAGGFGATDIDAGSAYDVDVKSYNGSLYATFGGESAYVDVALTYAYMDTVAKNIITQDEYNSHAFSGYIGGGKSFSPTEMLKLTPEASLLLSYYSQEGYDRDGITQKTIDSYDDTSIMGSLGVNLSTAHQLDWGFAIIPQLRLHWLHEFNADPNDFSYTIGGGSSYTFGVRPREENLLRFGAGLDIWSWKRLNRKLELDYNGLFSDKYQEHMVSGKITWNF